MIEKETKYFPV